MKTCIPCGAESVDETCPACGEASWIGEVAPEAPAEAKPVAEVVAVCEADISSAHIVAAEPVVEPEPTEENTAPEAPAEAKKGKRR